LKPKIAPVFKGHIRSTPQDRKRLPLESLEKECAKCWQIIDETLHEGPYLGGQHPSLADIAIGVYVHRWCTLPLTVSRPKRIEDWYGRLRQRPAYARNCTQPLA
jgi:glutathione S-transferase